VVPAQVKALIESAFAQSEYPGVWCLVDSAQGDEPGSVAEAFTGKTDWRTLDPYFIDQAPKGLGSSLSFFSDEAFRFYLPAFMLADIDGKLQQADPVFSLTHGLDDASRSELINQRRYGARTWFDLKRCKFAMFTAAEAGAIVEYLRLMSDRDDYARPRIDQALTNYWTQRLNPG
jgi:hypothetical protein